MPSDAAAVLDRPAAELLFGKSGLHTELLRHLEQGLGSPFNNWGAAFNQQVDPLTVRDILRWPRKDLLDIRIIGEKSLDALDEALRPHSLKIGQGPDLKFLSIDTPIGHVTYPDPAVDIRAVTFLFGHALANGRNPKDVPLREVLHLPRQAATERIEELSWSYEYLKGRTDSLINVVPLLVSSDAAVEAFEGALSVFRLRLGMSNAELKRQPEKGGGPSTKAKNASVDPPGLI